MPPSIDRVSLRRALRLMVIVDPAQACGRSVEEVARLALRGGATAIQLRDKQSDDAGILADADAMQQVSSGRDALTLINDRPDIARLAGCSGCHLGPQDLPVAEARSFWPEAVLGFSAGTPGEARAAADAGADYLGTGPIFATGSKSDAGIPIGLEGLRAVVEATSLPVVAIGGIGPGNAASCIHAGAAGVAAIRAVTGAASVAPAARVLRRILDAAVTPED